MIRRRAVGRLIGLLISRTNQSPKKDFGKVSTTLVVGHVLLVSITRKRSRI
jgi:hypothetical protein